MSAINEDDYEKFFEGCAENGAKQLDLVPDDDLSLAVMLRLLKKRDDEIFSLPLPCQYVLAIFWVVDRAYMEDFEQVYVDFAPYVPLAIDGLFAIGQAELGEVIKQSFSIYEESKDFVDKYNNNVITWGELLDLELWKGIEGKFNEVYPSKIFLTHVAKYIRDNYRCFLLI